MDPERWRKINEIFSEALEREESERAAFVREACHGDDDLLCEVESLLSSHAREDGLFETPAYEVGAELLGGPGGPPAGADALLGERLGPYAVKKMLGYGGMGVVYLAEDTRLDRLIALKALADHLGRDERSRERLRREAKAAAALSHPGIATVFALEEFDEHLYIVYEYVEGPTLREELDEGPVSGGRLMRTALDVARALESAHGHGIVHRDLKPENIIRTGDGGIKILDFGLASFAATPLAGAGSGEGAVRLTLPGVILGTPSYMAPEQLKGREVDFRADLFSFGVVLHEMATGLHPFEGDDPASTIARILEVEPRGLTAGPRADLPELEPVLQRLLCKQAEDRYGSTAELIAALERLDAGAAGSSGEAVGSPSEVSGEVDGSPAGAVAEAPPTGGEDVAVPRHDAFWWWRFHQMALAIVYAAAFYGLWWVKEWTSGGDYSAAGSVLFYAGVVPVIGAGSLRLHLAFAARYYPGELTRQLRRSAPWIRRAELLYALILLGGAALIAMNHPFVAAPMVAAAIGIIIFSHMIEPTTTSAAFPER